LSAPRELDFNQAVSAICCRDPRYLPEAYGFVRDALDYATHKLKKPLQGKGRHISGQELLECARELALREYGPMALTVLGAWGVHSTEDIGEIVFNLVEAGKLGKTDEDRREDFARGFDFRQAFAEPFLPRVKRPARRDGKGAARRDGAKRKEQHNG
jgi:uncharacterized repeat protein (TIGR04138 family)